MNGKSLSGAICALLGVSSIAVAAPSFHTNVCPVTINGVRVGSALTPASTDPNVSGLSSLRNTLAYEASTGDYHFWGFVANDPTTGPPDYLPTSASALSAVKHAISSDGIHFTSDRNLDYGIGSANWADYGATSDPPLDFFRALYDEDTGTWKLFDWTENIGSAAGQYNYNTSVNDLGAVASNTSVVHQGPLNSPLAGNHVGTFGLIDGTIYLRVDSTTGGDGELNYTDGIPPSTGNIVSEANLYTGTPYCWELNATEPMTGTDPPICSDPSLQPAYVHNVGRTLRQADNSIGTFYDFRICTSAYCNTSARADKNLWYVESDDGGMTWSAPARVYADAAPITIDYQPLANDAAPSNFANVDVINAPAAQRLYFSTEDTAGDDLFVTTTSMAADTIFADGFEGCGD